MSKTTTLVLLLGILASEPAAAQHGAPVRQPLPPADVIAKLLPDGGDEFNRLVFEKSPYLLQHARNPVDWYPWGPEAFEVAKREDKPVFLSVGYSTCHWCHVMEHESFEDEEVAKLMNEVFVCVKVDREERPDVDHVYMTVTQAMTGRGGWPMTVMMTPDQRPFFAGTYIPKDARGGRNGMKQLVPLVGEMWEGSRERLLEDANRIVRYLEEQSTGEPGGPVPASVLGEAFDALASRYDEVRGGFLPAPKFPRPHNLRFLLRYCRRTGDAKATEMVLHTLRRMRRGGVWDHVGLGFHRYSTDEEWLLPHFEKILYDQALIAMTAVEAWQATGEDDMRLLANEILAYVARDMTSPEGGFYSAEDADSEGEEGLFYVWTTEELVEVLGAEDGKLASEVWNAREAGNFIEEAGDGELNGRNVLHLTASLETLAAARETSAEELRLRLEGLRRRLFEHRVGRIHPLKDDKVLTDWNGLMIAAYAMAGRAFDDEGHVTTARRAADFLLARLRGEDGRLFKRYRLGSADLPGMLEDYAFAVWGLLELWETTFDARDLEAAIALTDTMLELFWDGESGGLFLSPVDGEELIVRAKEIYDGAIPSGNSVAALNLVRLARITGKTEYEQRADEILRAFSASIVRGPMAYTQLLLAQDFLVGPSHEVVVVGEPGAADTDDALRALAETFQPNKVVVFRPEGDVGAAVATLAPYTATQRAVDGKATIYVCRDFACLAPTTDVEAALESIASAEGEAEER